MEAATLAWPDQAAETKKEESQPSQKIQDTPTKAQDIPPKSEEVSTVTASSAMENILQHQEKVEQEQKQKESQEPTTLEQVGRVMSSVLEKAYDEAKDILPFASKSDAKSEEAIQQEKLEAVVDEEIQNETQPKNPV